MVNTYYEPARFPKRFVAYLIDVFVVGYFLIFLGAFAAVFSPILGGIFILLGIFGYFFIKDGIYNGQSLGKMILSLKVVKFSDQKQACNLIGSIVRNIVLEIPLAPLYAALQLDGDGDGRRIGDGLADTIVVDLKKPSKSKVKGEVKKSSGIVIWIILIPVIIVLLLVGVGMVLQITNSELDYDDYGSSNTNYVPYQSDYTENSYTPPVYAPPPLNLEDDNLKLYTHEEYEFEILQPKDWEVENTYDQITDSYIFYSENNPDQYLMVSLNHYEEDITELLKSDLETFGDNVISSTPDIKEVNVTQKEEIKIGKDDAIRLVAEMKTVDNYEVKSQILYLVRNNTVMGEDFHFLFTIEFGSDKKYYDEHETEITNIIDSFKLE
jgi:uncharacterized RDD family membrane protein YckC